MTEAQIINFHEEPRLRFHFISTETQLDGILLEHWLNIVERIPNASNFTSLKYLLYELIDLQLSHGIAIPPFNQIPFISPETQLPVDVGFQLNYDEVYRMIHDEKLTRLRVICEKIFKRTLDAEKTVGVFIGDREEQIMVTYFPENVTYDEMEVKKAIEQSVSAALRDVMQKFPIKTYVKDRPGDVLVGNFTVTTQIDTLLIENWLNKVEDDTMMDAAYKNSLLNLLRIQRSHNIVVAPFNVLPMKDGNGKLPQIKIEGLTNDEILQRIHKEKLDRLRIISEKYFKDFVFKTRRKAGLLTIDFDTKVTHKIVPDGLQHRGIDMTSEIESRYDQIGHELKELKDKEPTIKVGQFKDEALDVLKAHFERQKDVLIPELDIFTGVPRPTYDSSHISKPVIQVSSPQANQSKDFIDFSTPPEMAAPEKESHSPKMMGDLLELQGHKEPILSPRSLLTKSFLEHDFARENDPINILDTTPPVLILGQAPLQPQRPDLFDSRYDENRFTTQLLTPLPREATTPVKSFMEAASNWIKHAQVTLSQREKARGFDLYSEIMTAPSIETPISEDVIPSEWRDGDEGEENENNEDLLIGGI